MPTGQADFRSILSLISIYLDILASSRVSPYGGFGIGFSQNKLGTITITNPDGSLLGTIEGKSKTGYAWQWCFGAAIQMSERWLLDAGFHRIKGGDYESEDLLVFPDGSSAPGKDIGTLTSNEFVVSLQYWF
jgi:opacity protein-like surface antigen